MLELEGARHGTKNNRSLFHFHRTEIQDLKYPPRRRHGALQAHVNIAQLPDGFHGLPGVQTKRKEPARGDLAAYDLPGAVPDNPEKPESGY
jgi:hypothetical protein